jgi:hypothetical protein
LLWPTLTPLVLPNASLEIGSAAVEAARLQALACISMCLLRRDGMAVTKHQQVRLKTRAKSGPYANVRPIAP